MRKEVENSVINTVGYAEAKDKESFMIGVSVALSYAEDIYEKRIKNLEGVVSSWKATAEIVTEDMGKLVGVIRKYSPSED